ncbi:MAG: DNA polymerase III subunit delta [Clostridia bacterium]|jgi:DNA polymerase-3 subunit delta|nr:DNA polymerase III subunit delta [Clostridia bacterium]
MAYYNKPVERDEIKELKTKIDTDFVGAYLFHGEEEFLKNHYRKLLKDKIREEGMAEFNLVTVEFERDGTLSDIADALDTPPVMAPHKLVEVTGLDILSLKKEEEKLLLEAVSKRAEDTVLIFNFYGNELDLSVKKTRERKIIRDLVEAEVLLVEFPRQKIEKLRSWVDKFFTSEDLEITSVAIDRMIELCDYSMTRLKSEADKLVCRAKFEKIVEVPSEWVSEMVKPSAENEIFDLTDAIVAMNAQKAVAVYENLLGQNFDPALVFASIAKTVTTLAVLWSAKESGVRAKEAALSVGGIFDWQAEKYYRFLTSRTGKGLQKSINACDLCDRRLKGEGSDRRLAVSTLIVELTSEGCK